MHASRGRSLRAHHPWVRGGSKARLSSIFSFVGTAVPLLATCVGGCDSSLQLPSGGAPPTVVAGEVVVVDGVVATDSSNPEVKVAAERVFCCDPLAMDFTVELLGGLTGQTAVVTWEFGDGLSGVGSAVQHAYALAGVYEVTVSVALSGGSTITSTVLVPVGIDLEDWDDYGVSDSEGNDDSSGQSDEQVDDGDPADEPDQDGGGTTGDTDVDDGDDSSDDKPDPVDDGSSGDDGDGDSGDDGGDGGDDDVSEPQDEAIANAGLDQEVDSGAVVQLDGTASEASGSLPLVYEWMEETSFGVVIDDPSSPAPTFTAPTALEEDLVVTIKLTVTAGADSDTDSVTISVRRQNALGWPVEFLQGPELFSDASTATVTWRFASGVNPTDVFLRRDCCLCADTDTAILTPNGNGIYSATIDISDEKTTFYYALYTRDGVQYQSQAKYVNPVPAGAAEDPMVIWYHQREVSPTALENALSTGAFNHMMIGGGDRVGDHWDDEEVWTLIDVARSYGVQIIWSRHLWNNFEDLQEIEDTFDPVTYISAIAQTNFERDMLGVEYSCMDGEAYSGSPLEDYLREDLSQEDFDAMVGAMQVATDLVGRVDFMYPVGAHGRPMHPNATYENLCVTRIAESTYYDLPHKNCRITYEYDIMGAYVSDSTERPESPLAPFFLPHDILNRTYLWKAEDGALTPSNGLFMYPGPDPVQVEATALFLKQRYQP